MNGMKKGGRTRTLDSMAIVITCMLIFTMISPVLAHAPIDNISLSEKEKPIEPQGTIALNTLTRLDEPVIVDFSQVPGLSGTDVNNVDVKNTSNDILVYIWEDSTQTWSQIPFQVDERNDGNGSYFFDAANGILDTNDEIVFMSGDTGDRVSLEEWPFGCDGPRYEIAVTDPITPFGQGWAYIFASGDDKAEAVFTEDYVRFTESSNRINTDIYRMQFQGGNNPNSMLLKRFHVKSAGGGSGDDMIDRMMIEIWAVADPLFGDDITFEYTERNLGAGDFTFEKDGYVRAMANSYFRISDGDMGVTIDVEFSLNWIFYEKMAYALGSLDLNIDDNMFAQVTLNYMNLTIDHDLSMTDGLTLEDKGKYYDSHGNSATIDGAWIDENITNTSMQDWWQVDHPVHGGYVCVWNMSDFQAASKTLVYQENSTYDENGPPDHHSNRWPAQTGRFGNTGLSMNMLDDVQTVDFDLRIFPQAAGVGNVGNDTYNLTAFPLQVTGVRQDSGTIWVDKICDVIGGEVGNFVNYTIFYNNTGNLNCDFVWINDTLEPDIIYVGDTSGTAPTIVGNNYSWMLINVAPGPHSFDIMVQIGPSVIKGQLIDNRVFCNFTNDVGQLMTESSDNASFMIDLYEVNIALSAGWNFISIPVELADTNILSVLSSIDGDWDNAMWYDAGDIDHTVSVNNEVVFGPAVGGETGDFKLANDHLLNWTFYTDQGEGNWILLEPSEYTVDATLGYLNYLDYLDPGENITGFYNYTQMGDHWKTYSTLALPSLNTMLSIDRTMGFWIHALVDTNFTVRGLIPSNTDIDLHPGWNMVGYPSLTPEQADMTLPAQVTKIAVYNESQPYNINELPLASVTMTEGNGYWVYSTAAVQWSIGA